MKCTVKDIISSIPYVKLIGNPTVQINELVQLSANIQPDQLCWCSPKNMERIKEVRNGVIICDKNTPELYFNKACTYIVVDNPRLAFKKIIDKYFVDKNILYTIEKSAVIHPKTKIAKKVKIGCNVVIEEEVEIGENTSIGHNTVILKRTKIGKNVQIGANNTIGSTGFGYEKTEDGEYELIAHIGNVVIDDGAEIGNNTVIDRGVMGSTHIGKNVKIDNLVHVAHGVQIGKNSLVIANAMLAGSVKIGENAWIAPSASVLNKLNIGRDAKVGIGAVVVRDVPNEDVVSGNPARSIKVK